MPAPLNILLVDDDEVDAMTVKRCIHEFSSGVVLNHVLNGEEALAYLRDASRPRPHVILLDMNMPRMNGTEFLAAVKQDAKLKSIPVVVLTTSKSEADRAAAFGHGIAGYMVKTVGHKQFAHLVRTICEYWTLSEPDPL